MWALCKDKPLRRSWSTAMFSLLCNNMVQSQVWWLMLDEYRYWNLVHHWENSGYTWMCILVGQFCLLFYSRSHLLPSSGSVCLTSICLSFLSFYCDKTLEEAASGGRICSRICSRICWGSQGSKDAKQLFTLYPQPGSREQPTHVVVETSFLHCAVKDPIQAKAAPMVVGLLWLD